MKDLTEGSELKVIILFAIPMLIGNVFQQLYNTVDSIIVGNLLGKIALGAVGASFPIIFLMVSMVMGLGMGASVMISQFYGAKQMEKLKATIETFYYFLVISCILVTVAGIIFAEPILNLMNTPPEMLQSAKSYMIIYFCGMIFLFGFNGISAILRGLGDSKTPLYFLIISTVINIILDLLFIAVFKMGIDGAAYATVIAQALTFVGGMIVLQKNHPVLKTDLRKMKFVPVLFGKMVKIGLPTGIQQMLVAASFMAMTGIVLDFGTDAMAGFTSAGRVDSFAFMPIMSFSMALSAFAGQNIGAGKHERVVRGFRATLLFNITFAVVIGAIFVLFGGTLVGMFNQDTMVIAHGAEYLKIVGFFYWFVSIMFIVGGVLRGAGDTFFPMLISLLALWVFRIPLAHWLSSLIGPDGIWWSIPLGWAFGAPASLIYYLTGRWKKMSVVRHGGETPLPTPPLAEGAPDID